MIFHMLVFYFSIVSVFNFSISNWCIELFFSFVFIRFLLLLFYADFPLQSSFSLFQWCIKIEFWFCLNKLTIICLNIIRPWMFLFMIIILNIVLLILQLKISDQTFTYIPRPGAAHFSICSDQVSLSLHLSHLISF